MSYIKTLILLSVLLLPTLLLPARSSAVILFCPKDQSGQCSTNPCSSAPDNAACQAAAKQKQDNKNPITKTINTAANIIALIGGIIAVIMIIIGGLTMVTSAGNSDSVATARRRILYSLIGLVVIAMAWVITRFITDNVIG